MEDKHDKKCEEKKRVKVIHIDDCCEGKQVHKEIIRHFDDHRPHKGHRHHEGHKHKAGRRRHKTLLSTKMFTNKEEVVKYVDENATDGIFVEVFKVDEDFYKVELSKRD